MSIVMCRRSYHEEHWMVVVAEEDLVNHGIHRNKQVSRYRHCCALQLTEVDGQSSQLMHLSAYPQRRLGITGISYKWQNKVPKLSQILLRLGLCLRPRCGADAAPLTHLATPLGPLNATSFQILDKPLDWRPTFPNCWSSNLFVVCDVCAATAIYHGLLAILMLPFCLMGRKFYRRRSDGSHVATGNDIDVAAAINTRAWNDTQTEFETTAKKTEAI